jgi:hypothetical protein
MFVSNTAGIYATLGYNFSDPNGDISNLSADTLSHMNSMPAMINSWQASDITNNSVNGYFKNPVANDVQTIWNTANSIISLTADNETLNSTIYVTATALAVTSNAFMIHTNRISNVDSLTNTTNAVDTTAPYYTTAIAYGVNALYITNQSDGIINNSPILGSFTSILIGPQISANANTISPYVTLISNSIDSLSNTSNLSAGQITQINNDLSNTNSLLSGRRTADFTFYSNLKTFVNNYNTVRGINNMGETEKYLANNFIGTDKLKTRINS